MGSILFLSILWGGPPALVFAEAYKWVDEEGVIYFADDVKKIPEKYRGRAEAIPLPPPDESASAPAPPALSDQEADAQGHDREWWRRLVRRWERKRNRAEERIEALNMELRQLQFRSIDPHRREKEKQGLLKEIRSADEKLKEANYMLAEGLPSEARRAGAPPGWVRESGKSR